MLFLFMSASLPFMSFLYPSEVLPASESYLGVWQFALYYRAIKPLLPCNSGYIAK